MQISILSFSYCFFSLRSLPHLVQEVGTDDLMMSWWGFLLKFEPQALLLRIKSYNGSRMINFLMSFSVVVITMVSGCFKNTNKLIKCSNR